MYRLLRPSRPVARPFHDLGPLVAATFPEVPGGTREDTLLSGVTLNTGEVLPGDLYVALAGARQHGAAFAARAREAGAVAILTDEAGVGAARASGLPVAVVPSPREVLGEVSAWIYGTSSHRPLLLAVTGTNGKTSTVYILEAILKQLGMRAGLSATPERHVHDVVVESRLTTPEASELHALLARMSEDAVDAVALEVSAQGLSRHRVDGLTFDVAGFTNLSHDHLDEYPDMSAYLAAKAALFTPEHARVGVVSLDSSYGERLVELARIPVTTITTRRDIRADWCVEVLDSAPDLTRFALTGPDGRRVTTTVPLIGAHMAANVGLAVVMLVEAGFDFSTIARRLEADGVRVHVPGRSERIATTTGPLVYVDFSHTPDAFENTLTAVRSVTGGKVIMVVGADGDRDPSKRAEMGRVASEFSDILIVTDHHPRFEDPARIRAALLRGAAAARHPATVSEIVRPRDAIRRAVALAGTGDSILWAGPGLTPYRDIRGEHVPYSSHQDARAALTEAGWD